LHKGKKNYVPYDQQTTPLDCEKALLECAAGHAPAAGLIYQSEAPRLRAVAYRILRNRDWADDALHDAFVQILRDARHFDPQRGSARAWIHAIVRNTALKTLRRHEREVPVATESLSGLLDAQSEHDGKGADRALEYADLSRCLEALEPRRRASIILAFVDGQTHSEIANYLGLPVGTVKSWIRRELVALREQLK
jgi:RNA polymerase sigma-70 factor (ECF subfamily)